MKLLKNIQLLKQEVIASATDPFEKGKSDIIFGEGNQWVGYVFGSLFIVLGIAILFMQPKAKRKADEYKKKQMEVWKKNNPKRGSVTYEQTKMFLPPFEKAKSATPLFLGITFIFMGIAWIVGNTLMSL